MRGRWWTRSVAAGGLSAISLAIGLYALHQLPLDYAGPGLVVLVVGFMVGEAVAPGFGLLGLGGMFAFGLGAATLTDGHVALHLSWWEIAVAALVSEGFLVCVGHAVRAHGRGPVTGRAALVGSKGHVCDWTGLEGHVWAAGERWRARGTPGLAAGESVRIRRLDGRTLVVGRTAYEPVPLMQNHKGEA